MRQLIVVLYCEPIGFCKGISSVDISPTPIRIIPDLATVNHHAVLLIYLCLLPLVEHSPPTRSLQPTLSWATLSSCRQLLHIHLIFD